MRGNTVAPELSAADILELGVQIEKNGLEFFQTIAEKLSRSKAQYLFVYLSQEEERHAVQFERMKRMFLSGDNATIQHADLVPLMAHQHVFAEKNAGKKLARRIRNEKDALEAGMQFEEQSITYFEAMKTYVPTSQHYIINAIIQEEQTHYAKLADMKVGYK